MIMRLSRVICSFIVLEHDLYEITVDLAVGYTLNAALTHQPPFTVSINLLRGVAASSPLFSPTA